MRLKRWTLAAVRNWHKWLVPLAVAVVIFGAGYGFGSGRISLNSAGVPANSDLPTQLDYSTVNKVYQVLKNNYDGKLTINDLMNGLKHGLVDATGDPHTEYFTANEAKQFDNQLNNSFSGIGAEIGKDADGNLQIVSPIKGFPADKAGVKAGDLVASVDGQSTSGWSITDAVSKIRGKKGTDVKLGLVRHGQLVDITITRNTIKLPSVTWKMLGGKIGYMSIITFGDDTSNLALKAAQELRGQGAKSIILDLRGNPGGLLQAAVNVSSLWLPQGKLVVQEKRGPVVVDTYYATGNNVLNGLPTVVLINGGSASASEITAGALHDNGVATLIGTKSYGKGSVQEIEPLTGGAELKVTVAKWYRPDGQNIDKKGIKPDKKVDVTAKDVNQGKDPQLTAAKNYLAKSH